MSNNNTKTYWPHMILGFLAIGLTLSYWTVKSASSMPVQEANDYMLKYQTADMTINQILESKMIFDKSYTIEIVNVETMVMTDNINSNRPQPNPVKLSQGENHFSFSIKNKEGVSVDDAVVTFELTRPHTRVDDVSEQNVTVTNGLYVTKPLAITKPGRYTLLLRAVIGDKTGYLETSAYLQP